MKRKSFEQISVLCWMNKGESYSDAKHRLDTLWKMGTHPAQQLLKGK